MQNWQLTRKNVAGKGRFGQFIGASTTRLLKDLGARGQAKWQAIKALSSTAERARQWLWIKRGDETWARNKRGQRGFTPDENRKENKREKNTKP